MRLTFFSLHLFVNQINESLRLHLNQNSLFLRYLPTNRKKLNVNWNKRPLSCLTFNWNCTENANLFLFFSPFLFFIVFKWQENTSGLGYTHNRMTFPNGKISIKSANYTNGESLPKNKLNLTEWTTSINKILSHHSTTLSFAEL